MEGKSCTTPDDEHNEKDRSLHQEPCHSIVNTVSPSLGTELAIACRYEIETNENYDGQKGHHPEKIGK